MHIPHLTPWAGAMAGLRVVDLLLAGWIGCSYRHALRRMLRQGFAAAGSDVTGGALVFILFGVVLFMGYGTFLIVTKGTVPADSFVLTRLMLGTAFVSFNIGFTVLVAGQTTRAWLLKDEPHAVAARHGMMAYVNLAAITVLSTGAGALLAMVGGR